MYIYICIYIYGIALTKPAHTGYRAEPKHVIALTKPAHTGCRAEPKHVIAESKHVTALTKPAYTGYRGAAENAESASKSRGASVGQRWYSVYLLYYLRSCFTSSLALLPVYLLYYLPSVYLLYYLPCCFTSSLALLPLSKSRGAPVGQRWYSVYLLY